MKKSNPVGDSYIFGKCIGLEELEILLQDTKSQRSLVIHVNELVRATEKDLHNTRDMEDKRMLQGQLDAYNEFKILLKKK